MKQSKCEEVRSERGILEESFDPWLTEQKDNEIAVWISENLDGEKVYYENIIERVAEEGNFDRIDVMLAVDNMIENHQFSLSFERLDD